MVAKQTSGKYFREYPRLNEKLSNFIEDRKLIAKPAIIWQCSPISSLELDVNEQRVKSALQLGANSGQQDGWWHSFYSSQSATPVFDGIATHSISNDSGWTTEFHSDGHIFASLWSFPNEPTQDSPTQFVAKFHQQAFLDFGLLAASLREASSMAGECLITCTILNSVQLAFHSQGYRNELRHVHRENLHWRVRRAESREQIQLVSQLMGVEFLRAYGFSI
jgi:hypothetical protein